MKLMLTRRGSMQMRLVAFSVMLLLLSGCSGTKRMAGGIAIETLCREWGRSLPTRSRQDTAQTRQEIGKAYDVYEAACEDEVP